MKTKCFFYIFLFLFLFLSKVSAIGIGSEQPKVILLFQPGLEKTYGYTAVASLREEAEMEISINVEGFLSQYASLSETTTTLSPGESSPFSISLKLPNSLEPGEYYSEVCLVPRIPTISGGGGTGVFVMAAVCSPIIVLSLFPEPLAKFDLETPNIAQNEIGTFKLKVMSLSKQDFNIKGKIDIYREGSEEKITTIYTDEKMLMTGEREELTASLDTNGFEIGVYKAKATLYFVDKEITKEAPFRVGKLLINILSFSNELEQGKVNPIDIQLESKWNEPIKNIYAEIYINDSENNSVDGFKSPTYDIGPWTTKTITAYWNPSTYGKYYARVVLYYEDEISEKSGEINVVARTEFPTFSLTSILLIVLIVVVVILIFFIILYLRKNKYINIKRK